MTLLAITRRTLFAGSLLLACVPFALAGTGGTCLEEGARTRTASTPPTTHVSTHVTSDDQPGGPAAPNLTPARGASLAPSAVHGASPATPAAPARNEKRERGRTTSGTTVNPHRAPAQRSKGASRSTPATPGMGMLLRMGASAGREISYNFEIVTLRPRVAREGRAPPRGDPHPHLATALLPPGAPLAALRPRRLSTTGAPETLPAYPNTFAVLAPSREISAPAAPGVSPAHVPMEPGFRSRAVRLKGAVACPFMPFGGMHA